MTQINQLFDIRKVRDVYVSLLIIVLMASCTSVSNHQSKVDTDTTICDSYQRNVTFVKNPQRIISAAPGITEIFYALGQHHRLIARTDFCDFPAEVKNKPSIGGLEDPNIETIASLDPDLIIASTHFVKDNVTKIENLQIPIAIIKNHDSFEGAYSLITEIAKILDVPYRADSIIAQMKFDVAEVARLTSGLQNIPTVYFVIGFGKTGDYTAGGDTFISQLIDMAGGKNIAADLKGWSYSLEKLVENDPDVILIRTGDKELFSNTPVYKNLKAVKTGNVFEIDNNLFEITGPRLAVGLKQLFYILHPVK